MATNEERIKELAAPFLDPGEQILAALTAAPRGRTTASVGGGIAVSAIGGSMMKKQREAADAVGIVVQSNMALALTQHRLLTLAIKISAMGHVTEVKELLSATALSDIDSIEGKRFGLGGVVILKAKGGDPIKLECKAPAAKGLAEAFAGARAGA